ncbi:MAG: hypothetical protein JWQ39_2496 [Glaciihabitans sp.]|nr:hypothetical protein [Glaciihabitans sp.]
MKRTEVRWDPTSLRWIIPARSGDWWDRVARLLGAIHGTEWLGQLQDVQDPHYISRVASELVHATGISLNDRRGPSPRDLLRDLERRDVDGGVFPDGRPFDVLDRGILSERPYVVRTRILTIDGQSKTVDAVYRLPPSSDSGLSFLEIPSTESAPLVNPTVSSTPLPGDRIRVRLPTADVRALAEFYSPIVGRELVVDGLSVSLSDELEFVQVGTEPALWSADAQVQIQVADIRALAAENQMSAIKGPMGANINTVDPDGRAVLISEQTRSGT